MILAVVGVATALAPVSRSEDAHADVISRSDDVRADGFDTSLQTSNGIQQAASGDVHGNIDVSVDISAGRGGRSVVEDQLADEAIGVHLVDQLLDLDIGVSGHQGGKGADKQLG